MQTTAELFSGIRQWFQKMEQGTRWIHLAVWIIPCLFFNIPALAFTFGVFHSDDYSLLFPSIYGAALNALIVYGNAVIVQRFFQKDRQQFLKLSLLLFGGVCLLESTLDSLYFYLFYGFQNGTVLLDILLGTCLLNAIFFYFPSLVYGVLANAQQKEDKEVAKIPIKDGNESVYVTTNQLLYIKSDGNYCIYQTRTHKYLERRSLSSLENELPTPFIRCHKSYIVNTDLIDRQSAKEVELLGHKVPLGRKYKEQLSRL